MSKMILIAHNRYLNETRHGANLTFHYFDQKVIDAGKSFYIYDSIAENQPKIEEVPKYFRAFLKGEITDTPFYKNTDDVVLLGANIARACYQKYTSKELKKTVVELKKISEEYNVDIILLMKHRCVKKRMHITDFQKKKSGIGNVEKYFDMIVSVDPVKTTKGCVVRILKNNFGKLSEHYIN